MGEVDDAARMRDAVSALLCIGDELKLFAGPDGPTVAVLAGRIRRGTPLSRAEARAGWRLLNRYRLHPLFPVTPELPGGMAAGPVEPDPVAAPAGAPPPVRPEVTARIRGHDGRIGIVAPFSFNPAIKDIPGARWDTTRTQWHIPATPAAAGELVVAFAHTGARFSDAVAKLAAEAVARPVVREILDESTPLPSLAWAAWTKTDPWAHQKRAAVFLSESSAALFAATMGPQPVDTPILTPKGWRTLGDLAAGDEVFGADGRPVRIRDTRHYGEHPVLRVTLSDGTSTRCTAEHRWAVRSATDRANGARGRAWTTVEMAEKGLHSPASRNAARFFLPDASQVEVDGPVEGLAIPPYALGVLLGDGCLTGGQVSVTCPDAEVTDRLIRETGDALGTVWTMSAPSRKCPTVRARLARLHRELAAFGLTGRSETKRVPEAYLVAGSAWRRDLLRGLLDTDGHGTGNGGVEFCSASAELAGQVAWLARSLGAVVREAGPSSAGYRGRDGVRVECLPRHRVAMMFRLDGPCPLALSRKVEDWRRGAESTQRRRPPRSVKSITPDGTASVCCIELDVDDPDSAVYLTDTALIPTLNSGKTLATISALNRSEARRVLIVCPKKVLGVWRRELARHSSVEWHMVNGLRRNRNGREVALSTADRFAQAEAALFDCRCGKPHAVVVNYESLTYEPWASWDPAVSDGSAPVDVVVYDEAHRLRGDKVGKVAERYAKWIRRRWGLTGTPMPQGPLCVFGPFRALDSGIFGTTKTAFRAKYAVMGGFENKQVIGLRNAEELARRFFSITYMPVVELDLPDLLPDVSIEVDLEPSARTVYDALDRAVWADISGAVVAAGGSFDPERDDARTVSPANAAVLLLRLQQVAGGATKDDAGDVAVVSRAKQDALAELLPELGCEVPTAEEAKDGVRPEPVVVFCRFLHDLDAVREVSEAAGLGYAEVSGLRGDGLTSDSEMSPDADVVGVQIQSGGTGVDLTRARYGIWYSMGFSLSDYMQGRARIHRPGQARTVQYVHLVARDTVDTEVYAALEARQDVITAVLALHGHRAAGIEPGTWAETANPDGVDLVAAMVPLPPELAKFAPNARIGSPSGRAKGKLSGTRASQRQSDSVAAQTVDMTAYGLEGF